MRVVLLTLIACFTTTISFGSATAQTTGSQDLGAIWFVGDSITQSNADGDSSGSPRSELYSLLDDNGYTFTYTGHFTANPEGLPVTGTTTTTNLFQYHSGISASVIGDNISNRTGMTENLSSHWTSGRLATVKPDIILIMLGTNDIGIDNDVDNAPSRLSNYIDQIYAQTGVGDPSVFVASIPPSRRSTERIAATAAFNSAVPGIVSAQQGLGRDVHFVDQFTPLNDDYDNLMRSDDLHTNAAGNASLAQQWFNGIDSIASAPTQTVYIGDAADEGQMVLAGTNAFTVDILTIVNLSNGFSAAPVIYTSAIDQDVTLTEANFFTDDAGNLTPFVVKILGAAADGSFDGQENASYEVLAIGDAIAADADSLVNGAFTVNGVNPTISLSAGDRIAAGFLTDVSRLVSNNANTPQGVSDYIFRGDSISTATIGSNLTDASTFDQFDRSLSFNIGFISEVTTVLGDFDGSGIVDCDDLDGYVGNIGSAATGALAALDIDGNGTLDASDADTHITTLVQTSNGSAGTFPGDLNCDGTVDVLGDAFILIGNLGNTVTSYSLGDINFDGTVDVLGDAFILIGNLGSTNEP